MSGIRKAPREGQVFATARAYVEDGKLRRVKLEVGKTMATSIRNLPAAERLAERLSRIMTPEPGYDGAFVVYRQKDGDYAVAEETSPWGTLTPAFNALSKVHLDPRLSVVEVVSGDHHLGS